METTFIELKIGDPVYFVTIEKSVIKDGTKINTATIIGKTNTLRPYETELTLSNSDKIFVNLYSANPISHLQLILTVFWP